MCGRYAYVWERCAYVWEMRICVGDAGGGGGSLRIPQQSSARRSQGHAPCNRREPAVCLNPSRACVPYPQVPATQRRGVGRRAAAGRRLGQGGRPGHAERPRRLPAPGAVTSIAEGMADPTAPAELCQALQDRDCANATLAYSHCSKSRPPWKNRLESRFFFSCLLCNVQDWRLHSLGQH